VTGTDAGKARRPQIVDFHTHAFPDFLAARAIEALEAGAPGYKAYTDGTVADLLRHLDRAGIEIAVVCSIATSPRQVPSILEWSCQIASDRIIPFASVHPECEDLYGTTAGIARAGLKGVKLHPQYQGFYADDPEVFDIYRSAADHGLIILFHAGYDLAFPTDPHAQPHRIAAAARELPGLGIVASHMGGWRDWGQALEHLAGSDVYLDTSFAIANGEDDAPPALLARLLERHSPERILFGTDSPWREHISELAALDAIGLPDDTKRAVLEGNALRLLNLSGQLA
jgi:uncharacterized protein